MKQIRRNISLDEKTDEKLKELALDAHTSVSQWITDCVWEKAHQVGKDGDKLAKLKNKGTRVCFEVKKG